MKDYLAVGCYIAFIGFFYLIGFGVLGYGIWSARRSMQAGAWPTAPGVIQESAVKRDDDTWRVEVRYSYKVDGIAYEGSRLAFSYGGNSSKSDHEEVCRRLQKGQRVGVRYDPADPSSSCLSFGLHKNIIFVLVFAVVWLAFTIGFSVMFWIVSGSDRVLIDNLRLLP